MRKVLEPSDDLDQLIVPLAIDVKLVTNTKMADMPILEKVLEKAIEDVRKRFEKDGYQLYVAIGTVRPMTQEELLAVIPRKVHMADDNRDDNRYWLCSTAHVSPKNVTENADEVTCKLCLKLLGAS